MLCAALLWIDEDDILTAASGGPEELATVIDRRLTAVDLEVLGRVCDAGLLLSPLDQVVGFWQFTEEGPAAMHALAPMAGRLVPVAEALVRAPGAAWWWDHIDRGGQRWLDFSGRGDPPLDAAGAAAALAEWDEETSAGEWSEPGERAPWDTGIRATGLWWSGPLVGGLPETTRGVAGLPALQQQISEDSPPDGSWPLWSFPVPDGARVLEIDGPATWSELVAAHPREVTYGRRHDWWAWTGWRGRWLIPDWPAVAREWDAVHVSVAGNLTASYTALPVGGEDARTCLAGWDPDETIWLTGAPPGARRIGTEGPGSPELDQSEPWLVRRRPPGR